MKAFTLITAAKTYSPLRKVFAISALLAFTNISYADTIQPLVDDFSNATNNSLGIERQFLNDTIAGGGTTTEQSVSKGILLAKGKISPPRGQPGWASSVLLLDPKGLPRDVSTFDGIRLLIKINEGNFSISANSTKVTNFDYHAAPISVSADGKFHEIKIPFTSMKRAWSEQTKLDKKTINALSIVAFGLQKSSFDFAIDDVSFY